MHVNMNFGAYIDELRASAFSFVSADTVEPGYN